MRIRRRIGGEAWDGGGWGVGIHLKLRCGQHMHYRSPEYFRPWAARVKRPGVSRNASPVAEVPSGCLESLPVEAALGSMSRTREPGGSASVEAR